MVKFGVFVASIHSCYDATHAYIVKWSLRTDDHSMLPGNTTVPAKLGTEPVVTVSMV